MEKASAIATVITVFLQSCKIRAPQQQPLRVVRAAPLETLCPQADQFYMLNWLGRKSRFISRTSSEFPERLLRSETSLSMCETSVVR